MIRIWLLETRDVEKVLKMTHDSCPCFSISSSVSRKTLKDFHEPPTRGGGDYLLSSHLHLSLSYSNKRYFPMHLLLTHSKEYSMCTLYKTVFEVIQIHSWNRKHSSPLSYVDSKQKDDKIFNYRIKHLWVKPNKNLYWGLFPWLGN